MSVSHHRGDEDAQQRLRQRFMEQMNGTAKREYSAGRMGAEDDGDLAYALATDQKGRAIIVRFGKPVEWIGLSIKDAEALVEGLNERIMSLRTGVEQ